MKSDTWEGKENLKNAKEVIEECEKEYRQDQEDVMRQEREKGIFEWEKFPERYITRKLFR